MFGGEHLVCFTTSLSASFGTLKVVFLQLPYFVLMLLQIVILSMYEALRKVILPLLEEIIHAFMR